MFYIHYFCFSSQEAYNKLLPLYFPRSPQEEEDSINRLPKDVGNELGEPVIADRQIRIMDKPFLHRGNDYMSCILSNHGKI